MNKLVIIVVVILLGVGGWWGLSLMQSNKALTTPTNSAPAGTSEEAVENLVELKGFAFSPKTLTVNVGSTVTFKNMDVAGHTVTADDKSFESEVMNQGESTTLTFDEAGTFGYHCTPHPNMKFTVVVK